MELYEHTLLLRRIELVIYRVNSPSTARLCNNTTVLVHRQTDITTWRQRAIHRFPFSFGRIH